MMVSILLFVLALLPRTATITWLSDSIPYSDFVLYHALGLEISKDFGFYFRQSAEQIFPQVNWWPPIYPMFLALVYLVFGDHFRNAIWVQVFLGSVSCVFLYHAARPLAGETVARVAAVLMALNPHFIFMTNQLASENLFIFLLCLGLWILGAKQQRSNLFAGITLGAAALTRSAGLALLVPFAWGAWSFARPEVRRRTLIAFLLGTLCVVAPWTVRNGIILHSLAPTGLGGGINFYFGHNPDGLGFRDLSETPMKGMTSAVDLDARGYALSWEYIRQDPQALVVRSFQKLTSFLAAPDYALHINSAILVPDTRSRPDLLTTTQEKLARQHRKDQLLHGLWTHVTRVFHFAQLILAAATLCMWTRLPKGLHWIASLLLTWTLVHLVFWGAPRFRLPAEVFMALLAGFALTKAAKKVLSWVTSTPGC